MSRFTRPATDRQMSALRSLARKVDSSASLTDTLRAYGASDWDLAHRPSVGTASELINRLRAALPPAKDSEPWGFTDRHLGREEVAQ